MAAEAIYPIGFTSGSISSTTLTDGNRRSSKFPAAPANQFVNERVVKKIQGGLRRDTLDGGAGHEVLNAPTEVNGRRAAIGAWRRALRPARYQSEVCHA